jgi:hypothetical protein
LALFIITGIAIFVFSIARPEKDSFDARARILFRRQAGRHIDYIVERIKGILEHYAESTEVTVSIISFHAGENKYRVASKNITQVRSYIDDVETTYVSALGRTNVTLPPPGGETNRLIYLRIDGTPHGLPEPFHAAFERPVNCRVNRNGKCEVSSLMEYWVQADTEANTHTTRRYTLSLALEIENLTPDAVNIEISFDDAHWINEQIPSGAMKRLGELSDIKPGARAYNYRILAP